MMQDQPRNETSPAPLPPVTETYRARRERLRERLRAADLPGLLVSHAANRFYLSGFELSDPQCNESAGYVLVTAQGRDYLMTDPRYTDAALRLWSGDDLFVYTAPRAERIRDFLASLDLPKLGFESRSVSHAFVEEIKDAAPLLPTQGFVEELRLTKDQAEIQAMTHSASINHAVFAEVPSLMREGMTEAELAWEIEKSFRAKGASGLSFDPIVAVNHNAALPHAIPGETRITEGCLVLVDVGGRARDYCSDQTRTFWFGPAPSERFTQTVDQVRQAQTEAIKLIQPGVEIREAYLSARSVFEAIGVESRFTHALGHGIGLETHESPSLSSLAQGVFRPGMVVTVEPGLYYPDWGGVRWEYMVLVTESGTRVL